MGRKPCPYCHGSGCVGCNDEGEVDVMDLSQDEATTPTTVRGWLETLPEPLRTQALKDGKTHNYGALESCDSLPNALYAMYLQCGNGKDFYWHGVRHFVLGRHVEEIDEEEMTPVYESGYNAAKAAYESSQNAAYMGVSEHGAMFWNGKEAQRTPIFVAKSQENPLPNGKEKPYQVTEIWEQVSAKELAELRAKAAAWDTIEPKLEYLSNFFEDLRRLKP